MKSLRFIQSCLYMYSISVPEAKNGSFLTPGLWRYTWTYIGSMIDCQCICLDAYDWSNLQTKRISSIANRTGYPSWCRGCRICCVGPCLAQSSVLKRRQRAGCHQTLTDNFIPFNRHDVMMSCGLHLKQVWCYPISMPPMHDYWMRNIHCRCIVLGNGYEKDLCRPELSVIGLSWLLLCMFLRRWGQQHWTWHSLQRCGQFWTTGWTCWFLLPPWKTTKHWKKLKLLPWDDLINRWYILSTVPYAAWEDIRLPQRYSLPFYECRLKDSSSRMQVGSLEMTSSWIVVATLNLMT